MKKSRKNKKSRANAKFARFFTALIVISVIVCVILFANKNQAQAVEDANAVPLKKYYKTITIQPGDTLWSIADEYKMASSSTKEYVEELMLMNDLHNDNITSGQKLLVTYFE